jgi:hypothetical protein
MKAKSLKNFTPASARPSRPQISALDAAARHSGEARDGVADEQEKKGKSFQKSNYMFRRPFIGVGLCRALPFRWW